jgi:hypothetical protein
VMCCLRPNSFSEERPPQLQHNKWLDNSLASLEYLANSVRHRAIRHNIWIHGFLWLLALRKRTPALPPEPPLERSPMFGRGKSNPNSPGRVIVEKNNARLLEG